MTLNSPTHLGPGKKEKISVSSKKTLFNKADAGYTFLIQKRRRKMKNLFLYVFSAVALPAMSLSERSFGDKAEKVAYFLSEGRIYEANKVLEDKKVLAPDEREKTVGGICLTAALRQMTGETEEFDSSCLTQNQRNLLFLLAVRRKDTENVKKHIAEGADLNIQGDFGETALFIAASQGWVEIVEALLAGGANPNIQEEYGKTALFSPVALGAQKTVKILLAYGADPNIQDDFGDSALHWAAYNGHAATADLLLIYSADPNIQNKEYGDTALHNAVRMGRKKTVKILLAYDADMIIEDTSGNTAFDQAIENKEYDVAHILAEQAKNLSKVFVAPAWARSD